MIDSKTRFQVALRTDNIIAFIFALRAITFVWLAFASDIYMPIYANIVVILRYISIPLGLYYIGIRQRMIEKQSISLLIPIIYYWLMLVFNTYGGYKGSYIQEVLAIGCFVLMCREEKKRIFEYFYKVILAVCIISIVLYIFHLFKFPIGFTTVPFYNNGTLSTYYKKWFIFCIMDSGVIGNIPRLCGIFNEPGAFGTVCALLFCAIFEHSSIKEKIVIITSIIFSFSLAGYVIVLIYLAIQYSNKNIKYSIVSIAVVIIFLAIPYIDWGNENINHFAQRFLITEAGLQGNNRSNELFSSVFGDFLHSSDVLFGKGANYSTMEVGVGLHQRYFYEFGILGFGLYFAMWLIGAIREAHKNKACIILLVIFIVSLLQRPVTLTNSYGYVLLFGGYCFLQSQTESNN